jgi:hypothetical protein
MVGIDKAATTLLTAMQRVRCLEKIISQSPVMGLESNRLLYYCLLLLIFSKGLINIICLEKALI